MNQDPDGYSYFFAIGNLSSTEKEVVCFWDDTENRKYAKFLGLHITWDQEDLQEYGVKYTWSKAHEFRGVYKDDPVVFVSLKVLPVGVNVTPIDAIDFESYLDEVERGEPLEFSYWDYLFG